jgi:cyclic beta-1,2-glucan synthetase
MLPSLIGISAKHNAAAWNDTQSITAEIFGLERSKQHARSLAETQQTTDNPPQVYSIIDRLADNAKVLRDAYNELGNSVAEGKAVTPAAEWLIDNYHLVEEQIRQTTYDLPPKFYRQLPKLAQGPLAGHPRIFGLVWAYVAHSDSNFNPETLTDFVNEYQTVQPLTIGELWAVAISLRLLLIENLRRSAQRIIEAKRDREIADKIADQVIDASGSDKTFTKIQAQYSQINVTQQFAVQFIQRLRDQNDMAGQALDWLRNKTEEKGYTLEAAVNDEQHRQGAANVTVRNIVTSLRFISDVNWEVWFDSVSLVDKLLRKTNSYAVMDFASRTIYRSAVEELSRGTGIHETDVAQQALDLGGVDPGFHLIGNGRVTFESKIDFKPTASRQLKTLIKRSGLWGYLGTIAVLSILAIACGAYYVVSSEISSRLLIALVILAILPATEFGVAIANFMVTQLLDAAVIPGLALRDGVPPEFRTLVVVPSLLTSRDEIEELIDRLEVHFLSNDDGEIYFALLTDWGDSNSETKSDDQLLLNVALEGMARLNKNHETNQFLLLHRGRKWNPQQGKWMGWERKRGKLHELNRLLRGAADTSFVTLSSKLPDNVRFVITLDADTKLPRDAARRLIGKLGHPLNKAKYDATQNRVVEGFGVLQPRVTPSLPTGHYGSIFQRIYSSTRGIDPYAFAVSDVYQDMFGEGSFAGKGIYDIDAFEQALENKIPENTVLSHDLFEGIFARAALITDVEVVEEFPERYAVSAARQHRWTRGDWQLIPWILGRKGIHVPALGMWKMVDNLRRSLTPVATLFSLLVGWAVLPMSSAIGWTAFIILLGLIPPLVPAINGSIPRTRTHTLSSRLYSSLNDFRYVVAITASNLLFLAHQTGLMVDAIARTLFRLWFSKKNLLEWTTAAQSESAVKQGISSSYDLMSSSVVAGLAALTIALVRGDGIWMLSLPFAMAWLAAPALAFWMSKSTKLEDALASSPEDRKVLRLVARRTWRFFESFVTAQDNMLPPDNFQEVPKPIVAHRTSPTNIGLYLLSIAAAREFGWIGLGDAIKKIEATLATLGKLEKYQGHLYNWYDTTDLRVLEPKYVSTVDSGNLAGHLIALSNYCSYWIMHPRAPEVTLDGITDILAIISEDLSAIPNDRRRMRPMRKQLEAQIETLRKSVLKAAENRETISIRLIELAVQAMNIQSVIISFDTELGTPASSHLVHWSDALRETIESHFRDSPIADGSLKKRLEKLFDETRQFALAMDFSFLLDPQRMLLSIGYRVAESMRDESCYDMLASEARLASYFAIAKGDLRTRHWFRLGRTVTGVKGGAALLSWSGSMFEYLMPTLVMRAPSGGLLDQTTRLIVDRQMSYASALGIPWGISESAFNARDIEFTYQYSNFGVPGLGLKRGLSENTVIAPYATGLAAMIAPIAAAKNYLRLEREGGRGDYGYYESMDYTLSRLRIGEKVAIVQAYFAHHQGMTIVALFNAVKNGEMRDRFHDEPIMRASELLLQERAPRNVPVTHTHIETSRSAAAARDNVPPTARVFNSIGGGSPATHLLSNGEYTVMLTAAGSGYSTWKNQSITRWREDGVKDDWGSFIYLREIKSGKVWSAGHMPVGNAADQYFVSFLEDKAEFVRRDGYYTTVMECVVSPEDSADARTITISNSSLIAREVELTTFAELVLAPASADVAHPAFSKMFVQTEYLPEIETLLATRRRRSESDPEIWAAQFMMVQGATTGTLEYETDRARFIGVGNTKNAPNAVSTDASLSRSVGTVLDPIFALRQRFRIPPGRKVKCTVWTVVANTREEVLDLVDRHRQATAYERAAMLAWTQAQIQLRHLSISNDEANLYQTLASHLIYANPALRIPSKIMLQNLGPQSALWPHSISGDRPILLLRIDDVADIELVHQILHAFEYWKSKTLMFDLVILNERMSSYVQDLQGAIEALVRKIIVTTGFGQVYIVRADLMSPDTLRLLPTIARVVLYGRRGDLASQLGRIREVPPKTIAPVEVPSRGKPQSVDTSHLEFFNGYGGFDSDGREYVTVLTAANPPPAPWINIIANSNFGFHSAADGGGYTWFGNSRENQLTAWSNDPVRNPPSEVIYVQDESSGLLMSPTLQPLRSAEGTHIARHGFGYTSYERQVNNLRMELLQFVALTDSVKISKLTLRNEGPKTRTFTITFYAEWVLGQNRASTASFLTTMMDEVSGALIARNPWKIQGGDQVAFVDMDGKQISWTADRREFLGAYGNLSNPDALSSGATLSQQTGAGMDPCCAMQTRITLAPGEIKNLTITLGASNNLVDAQNLVSRYRNIKADDAKKSVSQFWADTLNAVQVKTPDRTFDIILNGWMLYQTLACRMWARSGFYQASGAYGFRDQLQDSMALLTTKPEYAREHILRAASRQFVEGDFQHWWLPATGMGVRTHISDDAVWLANCVGHYVKVTGDLAILDENISYIEGQGLMPGEHDAFFLPSDSEEIATLYEHCCRALNLSLPAGEHGLPLMGTGDWNDGMNRVGELGKGESVWLGWFLLRTLKDFMVLSQQRGDKANLKKWQERATTLVDALENQAWDGEWYRRGFFDDGSLLGSIQNDECQIDAIAQSWSVLSGGAAPSRAVKAMDQSYAQLVRPKEKLMRLFTPPFNKSAQNPGYVKAYPPGIRENGGQYTHGVIWSIFAHAELKQAARAIELFSIINPINHARTELEARNYRVEPYVIAADVYSVAPHIGRGGWTWYTGSAGWFYRAGVEAILGVTREGAKLRVKPCIPQDWNVCEIKWSFGKTVYQITLTRNQDVSVAALAEVEMISPQEFLIAIVEDGKTHKITLPLKSEHN